ncbi:AfsR/SARP family transcriptional regulator [Dactylosporangium siamense]|uniref:SARP family transcriptional regulator n=1 Tax=Dactylosporangium siamense TaxID=685454 RepID=A0A919UES2_9ACTN|nr:BTAD domain-containing putative transcriptional regulator [Dactylosporangium siamense]GIG47908.1 SARP family transcriptional regulator [Dactylosporangium siamense]
MEFGVLGPLTVIRDGRPLRVEGLHSQRVLAGLLLDAGRPVSVGQLIDLAWDEPPATARQQLRTAVHRLRRTLGPPAGPSLRTVRSGYQLDLADCRFDVAEFTTGVAGARRLAAADALAAAADAFHAALALWRGEALAGLAGDALARHATRLDELRLAATEECAEVELRLGRHRRLVPQLRQLTAEHPLRERFAVLLMTALIHDGQRPDAIAVYQEHARRLHDDLGIDPGDALREAYLDAIGRPAAGDPVTSAPPSGPPPSDPPPSGPAPRHLPRAPRRLIGREPELDRIAHAGQHPGPGPHVVVIDGMAGVGKSALALTAARAAQARYPDAHLFIDLHGHSEHEPVTTHDALGILLRQLEVDQRSIPDSGPERVALWRRRLQGQRTIVLLDNAAGSAQIDPLLDLDGPGLVLVTSRTRLAPIDGATCLSVDLLDQRDAVALLRDTADDRVSADPVAAAAIVELCGRLPLAVRLVGHRLRHRPRWTIDMMATQLADAARAPIAISAEGTSAEAAFDLSYRQLQPRQQLLFRRLGLHPAGTFEVWAAASLADLPMEETTDLLDRLVEVNLVQADIPGQYRLHDLVRAFAASLVTEPERAAAVERMLHGYLYAMDRAGHHLMVTARAAVLPVPPAPYGPVFADDAAGAAWALANWPRLMEQVRIAEQAAAHGYTARLALMALHSADVFGLSADGLRLAEQAIAAAETLGEDALVASANHLAGGLYLRLGRYADCRASVERAIHLYQRLGNQELARNLRKNTIILLRHEGRHLEGVRLAVDVCRVAREQHDPVGEAIARVESAATLHQLGRHLAAQRELIAAVPVLRLTGHALSVALGWLGSVNIALGQHAAAGVVLTWAINLKRQLGNLGGAAETLSDYGRLLTANGDPQAGLRLQQQAYDQACALSDGYFEPIIANHLGETLTVLGRGEEALTLHGRALHEARRRQWPYEQARAHAGIAAALLRGRPERAAAERATAVARLTALGMSAEAAADVCDLPARNRDRYERTRLPPRVIG